MVMSDSSNESTMDVEMERKLDINLADLVIHGSVRNRNEKLIELQQLDATMLEEVKIQLQARGLVLGMKAAASKRCEGSSADSTDYADGRQEGIEFAFVSSV